MTGRRSCVRGRRRDRVGRPRTGEDLDPVGPNINAVWSDPAEDEAHVAWTRAFWEAMRPCATGGVHVNSLGDEGEERVRAACGAAKYERLAALKRRYDPVNFFRMNQNIRP